MLNSTHIICILFTFIFILVIIIYVKVLKSRDIIVITYETDLNNSNYKVLKQSLQNNNYIHTALTEKKWKGFGGKVNFIHGKLKKMDPEQVVIISDARDVISVNFNSNKLLQILKSDFEIESKIVISTEIGCCVPARFKPGNLRSKTGKVLNRTYEKVDTKENFDNEWKVMFNERAKKKNIQHKVNHKQSIYLNAGLYAGKVKNICKLYDLINIENKEDDQLLISEIFFHYPEMFNLDYNRIIFSNSHVWDSFNKKLPKDDSGCYYKKHNNQILDTYLESKPFFIHTPGKHFRCFDYVRGMDEMV